MTVIVLVHGAWQGAWCWEPVAALLRAAGHDVVTPTLTGSGDRSEALSPAVTLTDHVNDVIAELDTRDLREVMLVGHSYAGMVITGVAERAADRLSVLTFVDAFYPSHGESALNQMDPPFQQMWRQRAQDDGDGWLLPATDGLLDVWGIHDPTLRQWVRPRLTNWSLNCFTSPVDAPAMHRSEFPRLYVSADGEAYPAKTTFAPMADKAAADGCRVDRLPTGHDVMLEAPRELADLILASL
jgi:pimeloyl-ACP methyl ester carboxylesterase